MSKIDKYIKDRSKRDAEFAKAVEKDKENLRKICIPLKRNIKLSKTF